MAKKECFPPLWTTFSRCHEYFFGWQALGHIHRLLLVFLLLRCMIELLEKAWGQTPLLMELSWTTLFSAAAGAWLLFYIPLVLYTRLWISEEGIAWRSISGKGALSWQEVHSWTEVSNPVMPFLSAKQGVLSLPIAHLQSPQEIRQRLADRGLCNRFELPLKAVAEQGRLPGYGFLILAFGPLWAADLVAGRTRTVPELILSWICIVGSIAFGLLILLDRLTAQEIHADRIVQPSIIPRKSFSLLIEKITRTEPRPEGDEMPSILKAFGSDDAGRDRQVTISSSQHNFLGIVAWLEETVKREDPA